jgi:drug/metabolite transporter (DMT)-like permease
MARFDCARIHDGGLTLWPALLGWYRISSSMTAVLFSTCPLFVALFTPLLTQDRVPRRAVFAMVVALGGISALFYTGLSLSVYLLLGGGAVMLAVVISSWSAVFAKREISDVNPLVGTAIQFCVSAVVLFARSLIFEQNRPSDWNQTSILALIFLTVFASVVAFSLYYWLLKSMQAYQLSTTNLIVPVITMLEGALLLREPVPLTMIGAAVLVLVAVGVVLKADDDKPLSLELEGPAVKS